MRSTINGGDGDDLLTDFLMAPGDELFLGFGGNDTLRSSVGMDTLDGGNGFDIADFSLRTASVTVLLGSGQESSSSTSLIGIEGVVGSALGDTIQGNGGNNALSGGAGNDMILADLPGGAGEDTVDGGDGNDTLNGGAGFDLVSYAAAGNGVTANLATGQATGQGIDIVTGFEGVIGSAFNDTLTGDDGDNLLNIGSGGADAIIGGLGFDKISFANLGQSATVTMGTGQEISTGTRFGGVEAVQGSSLADFIQGDAGNNWLGGGEDDDDIDGAEGSDTVDGGGGDDNLIGGPGFDTVTYALATNGVVVNLATSRATGQGNDTISEFEMVMGSAFADTLTGDASDNWFAINTGGADVVQGGLGFDVLHFVNFSSAIGLSMATGREAVTGVTFSGIEGVCGSRFGDNIAGVDGMNTWLRGHDGNDTIVAGNATDTVNGGAGDDSLDGGAGFDVASFANATGSVNANLATQTATGDGNDTLFGFEALIGSTFGDVLVGNGVNNWIKGRGGADTLTGGAGADDFQFTAGTANGSRVTDFSGAGASGDRLLLEGYGAGASVTSLGSGQYQIANAGGTVTDVITVIGTVATGDWVFL
jgi:Ca2+-binding RTX toxin-like protein